MPHPVLKEQSYIWVILNLRCKKEKLICCDKILSKGGLLASCNSCSTLAASVEKLIILWSEPASPLHFQGGRKRSLVVNTAMDFSLPPCTSRVVLGQILIEIIFSTKYSKSELPNREGPCLWSAEWSDTPETSVFLKPQTGQKGKRLSGFTFVF